MKGMQMDHITGENRRKFEALVSEIMSAQGAAGMAVGIVDRAGQVRYQQFFGYRDEDQKLAIDENTIFGLASVTKSFTALAILQLAEQGILSLDDPVSQYVPDFTNQNQSAPVRIWHLLCHSGGFFPLPRIVVNQVAAEMGLDETVVGDLAYHKALAEEGARQVASRLDRQTQLIGVPGERMSYCNDGFGLLSDIIKNVGGEASFADYIREHITRPLGMERSYCDFVRPAQDENAALLYTTEKGVRRVSQDYHDDAFVLNGGGAMKSTLRDMLQYVTMYLRRGKGLTGARLASEYSIREMCKPRQYYTPWGWYGYGLCLKELDGYNVVEHGGSLPGVSSNLSWSYEADIGIVVLCNTMDVPTGVVADAALRMYLGKEPLPVRRSYEEAPWDKELLRQATGNYVMGEGESFTLSEDDGKLTMTVDGALKEICPIAPDLAITRGAYSDGFVQLLHDEQRGLWGARCGSRIYPKVN